VIDPIHIVQTEAQATAAIHLVVPRAEIQQVMGPAIAEVMAAVAAQGLTPAGPVFSYHPRIDPEVFDFEVGVPVASPVAPVGRVVASTLPAARVARTIYHGPYEGLGAAWGEFDAAIRAQGHEPGPGVWECYVTGPDASPDPAAWRTELNHPILPNS